MNLSTIFLLNWLQGGQLLLSLSILVILHEFGHYITAKWFGVRVEKFYLFFDPWFSLFKKKVGETEYGVGWLPLGGYVKLAGMIDESMDKEQMQQPAQSWEFRSKPAWQRLIIMLGGIIMNILVAFFVYGMILFVWGDHNVPVKELKTGLSFNDSLFQKLGFKNGDNIVAVDGRQVENYEDIVREVLVVDDNVTVIRDGKEQTIKMPKDLIGRLIEMRRASQGALIMPRIPAHVAMVADSSAAYKAGLRQGDRIVSVANIPTPYMDEVRAEAARHKNETVPLAFMRGDSTYNVQTTISPEGTIGYMGISSLSEMDSLGYVKLIRNKYGFFEAMAGGVGKTFKELISYIDQFKKILSPSTGAYKGLGGFKSMGSVFNKYEWNWEQFWNMTGLFSIILAFMNLLPIPALDGGHVMFTLWEMITGRKPNEKFLEYAQIAGMVILLALMLYANGNDFFGFGKGR